MQLIITATGPDHRGLADPIVHCVTQMGANIAEIQMFDHDREAIFSMLTRIDLPASQAEQLDSALAEIGKRTGLSIRTWSPERESVPLGSSKSVDPGQASRKPKLAICATYRQETPRALLSAIADGTIDAEPTLFISNRTACQNLAHEFDVPWHCIGNSEGHANDQQFVELCDSHQIDYIILARYMRVLPPTSCWQYAGGRIINLHHGLLPCFPGMRPYHEAYASHMLTFGATCHFIVPELDAGNQIIYQSTFEVPPGTSREEVICQGQKKNEPHCLVEGVRRVVAGEVQLHFNRVVVTP